MEKKIYEPAKIEIENIIDIVVTSDELPPDMDI